MRRFSVGIAAGMIKSAEHIQPELAGFVRFITFGSFTLDKREGNKEPVYYFDDATNTSINAIGLKNEGLAHFLAHELPKIIEIAKQTGFKICISLAPLQHGDLKKMFAMANRSEYLKDVHRIEINAACPNHREGQDLQPVLAYDPVAIRLLLEETKGSAIPKALKIAPDTTEETLRAIVELCIKYGIDYIVSGNTRRQSSLFNGQQKLSVTHGGAAGAPLLESGVAQVAQLKLIIREFPVILRPAIIGCGGIMNASALRAYKDAGAIEAQVATLYYQYGVRGVQDLLTEYYAH